MKATVKICGLKDFRAIDAAISNGAKYLGFVCDYPKSPRNCSALELIAITNKIYNESCLETLKKIPDNFIDLVITSPPYNMNLRIRNGVYCSRQIVKEISTKYDGFADNMPIDEYYKFHSNIMRELLRVSNLVFYVVQVVTGSKRALFKLMGEFNENLKDIIIWDKKYA